MGGLIARYTIGRMLERGHFDRMQPLVRIGAPTHAQADTRTHLTNPRHATACVGQNYVTIATPHLGIARPSGSIFGTFYNNAASVVGSHAGSPGPAPWLGAHGTGRHGTSQPHESASAALSPFPLPLPGH